MRRWVALLSVLVAPVAAAGEMGSRLRMEAFRDPALHTAVCRFLKSTDSRPLPASCLRFVDNGDGTVTDRETGLAWLLDATCTEIPYTDAEGRANFADARAGVALLGEGLCGLTDGSRPGDWRLPTRSEWQTLIERAEHNGCLAPGPFVPDTTGTGCWSEGDPFLRIQTSTYWSSTVSGGLPPLVSVAVLFYGNVFGGSPYFRVHVWPVRDGP